MRNTRFVFSCLLLSLCSAIGSAAQQFASPTAVGNLPATHVIAADVNHDGHADLIYIGVPDHIAVQIGNGDGTFRAPVNFPAGNGPTAIAVGDFSGDGKLDIAVLNTGGTPPVNQVAVLHGNGDGTFQAPLF